MTRISARAACSRMHATIWALTGAFASATTAGSRLASERNMRVKTSRRVWPVASFVRDSQ